MGGGGGGRQKDKRVSELLAFGELSGTLGKHGEIIKENTDRKKIDHHGRRVENEDARTE